MVLNQFRAAGERVLNPVADRLGKVGADRLTWISLLFAAAGGVSFALARDSAAHFLLIGALLAFLNALFDALDGIVARRAGSASPAGDFLDHVVDRYSDLFLVAGLAFSPLGNLTFGIFALTGISLTSYLGTQAAAVGLKRDYGGVLGRADRLVLLVLAPLVQGALIYAGVPWGVVVRGPLDPTALWFVTVIGGLLILFGLLGHITAVQRFVRTRRELKAASLEKAGVAHRPGETGQTSSAIENVDVEMKRRIAAIDEMTERLQEREKKFGEKLAQFQRTLGQGEKDSPPAEKGPPE